MEDLQEQHHHQQKEQFQSEPIPSTSSQAQGQMSSLGHCVPLEERVTAIEKALKYRCDGLSKEIKLILAELNIITEWISTRFEVELIDKKSVIFKTIHKDLDQVEELSKSLSLLSKIPIKDLLSSKRVSEGGGGGAVSSGPPEGVRRGRGRPPGSGSKISSNKSSQKTVFKGVLGTWIDSKGPKNLSSGISVNPFGLIDVKQEQEDYFNEDPFEDGYIPEVDDDDGNMNDDDSNSNNAIKREGTRPRRSATKNVSYDGFMESDEEDYEPHGKKRSQQRKRRSRSERSTSDKDAEYLVEGEDKKEPKGKGPRKKYKPSEASAMRAKILANTPMMCDECGKVVKGPWTLKAHKEMHANIRRYTCHVCGYAFRRKPHLNAHLLLHEGIKHLKCQYCGRGFYLRRDLARHERTHTGERPYACTFPNCGKSFNVKQHLTMHFRTHTGERPYKCTVCEKSFSQANTLRIHKKLHEGGSTSIPRRRPRQNKAAAAAAALSATQIGLPNSSSTSATTTTPNPSISASIDNSQSSSMATAVLQEASQPSSTCSTPAPPSVNSQHDYRSPADTHLQQSQSPFSETRQQVSNIPNISNTAAQAFDMINHSWRQGIGQQSALGNPAAGLFLPQIYEPLNMHYGSYPPNNN